MAFELTLQLKQSANPHLYVNDIKNLMKNDSYLHPLMKNTLLLLKKTRLPYLRLASKKDIVFIPEEYTHMERALEPALTGYERILWSEEEKQQYNTNPKQFFANLLQLYASLGYEIVERKDISEQTKNELLILTNKAKESQQDIIDRK